MLFLSTISVKENLQPMTLQVDVYALRIAEG